MTVYSQETEHIEFGKGLFTAELASNIPEGFSAELKNFIVDAGRLELRKGFNGTVNNREFISLSGLNHPIVMLDGLTVDEPVAGFWGPMGAGSNLYLLRNADPVVSGSYSGQESLSYAVPNMQGMCQYGDRIYVQTSTAINRITAIDWSTPSVTLSAISGGPGGYGIFSFKDRLWCWNLGNLYFTDVATVGGYPETWDTATQSISFSGPNGNTYIINIQSAGNRLVVFTTDGVFTLFVEGQPSQWIRRPLDLDSRHPGSHGIQYVPMAFSYNNVVFFADPRGVWFTNGVNTPEKMSQAIENHWSDIYDEYDPGNFTTTYFTCNLLDEGVLVSIFPSFYNGSTRANDYTLARTFYTKMEYVAWTEFDFVNHFTEDAETYGLLGILSVSQAVQSLEYGGKNTQFALVSVTRSTDADPSHGTVVSLRAYDGAQDDIRFANTTTITGETHDVQAKIRTRYTNGAFPTKIKRMKWAYLYTYNAVKHKIKYRWISDLIAEVNETEIDQTPTADKYQAVKLKGIERYRETALDICFTAVNGNRPMLVKGLDLIRHTELDDPKNVR